MTCKASGSRFQKKKQDQVYPWFPLHREALCSTLGLKIIPQIGKVLRPVPQKLRQSLDVLVPQITQGYRESASHFGSSHFMLEIPFLICSQWVRLYCGSYFVSCGGVVFASLALDEFTEWSAMVSKPRRGVLGFRARSELKKVLESAISIDRRKEWTCKFCSESSVWTSWRCRRCCSNIPVAAKSEEWSTGSSTWSGEEDRKHRSLDAEKKELRARIDALEKKEGVQGGVWGEFMEVEDEAESRKKLGEQKRKLQKELRDVDRLSFVSKEMQESIKESLQHSCKR